MKTSLIAEIESAVASVPQRQGLCLYIAHHTMVTLRKHSYNAVLQAGSMQWPLIKPENDDGVSPTHFAYMWSPETLESQEAMSLGMLPEMHVWVGIVDTQEVVDFSTRHLREAAELRGFKWGTEDPPKYVWSMYHELPDWVVYQPNPTASVMAHKILKSEYPEDYIQLKRSLCSQ